MVDNRPDYRDEATALFTRFAQKHELIHSVEDYDDFFNWEFPVQERLSLELTLGFSFGDELHFGVEQFWSYFFPFPERAAIFERALDAWVEGNARVVPVPLGGRALQLLEAGRWKTIYWANCFWLVPRNPKWTITNQKDWQQV